MVRTPFKMAGAILVIPELLVLPQGLFAADVAPEELRALEARRRIASCVLEVQSKYWWRRPNGEENEVQDHRIIYFEGENIRNDKIEAYDPATNPGRGGTFRTISCLAGREHIHWSDRIFPNGHTYALTIRPTDFKDTKHFLPVDPRVIGMTTTSILNTIQHDLETTVGYPDRRSASVSDAMLGDDACRVVEYVRRNGVREKIWICPDKGHAVLRIEQTAGSGSSRTKCLVECGGQIAAPNGIWFPTVYRCRDWIDGILKDEENATIKIISMNKALPTDTFTLGGIGVPAGTRIDRVPSDGGGLTEYWDGRQIAVAAPGQPLKVAGSWTWRRIALAAVSVAAALAAAYYLLQRTRAHGS